MQAPFGPLCGTLFALKAGMTERRAAPPPDESHSMPAAPATRAYRAPAFVVAMLLLVAVGVTMMFCVRSLTTASELTTHANRVIATTESLRAGHRMVETSATAYLQTGESRFLREYMSEAPTLRTGTQSLAALIESSHDQHARVTQIGALVEARLARLRQEVDRVVEKQVAASPGRPVDADAGGPGSPAGSGHGLGQGTCGRRGGTVSALGSGSGHRTCGRAFDPPHGQCARSMG